MAMAMAMAHADHVIAVDTHSHAQTLTVYRPITPSRSRHQRTRENTVTVREPSDNAVITYRYLRLGLVAAVAWLLISVAETSISTRCVQESLSDFYYTTSHSVFVAALCVIGVVMIVYQGSIPAEEILLDFSGFLAIVVAVVPTTPSPAYESAGANACGLSLPTEAHGTVGSENNLSSLLATSAVVVLTYWVVKPTRGPDRTSSAARRLGSATGFSARLAEFVLGAGQVIASTLAVLYVLAGIIWFIATPNQFQLHAHSMAALGLFVGIVFVSIFYASYAALEGKAEARIYSAIATLMAVTLTIVAILREGNIASGHATLWSEIILIVEFASFWLVQTRDLWHTRKYTPHATAGARQHHGRPQVPPKTAV